MIDNYKRISVKELKTPTKIVDVYNLGTKSTDGILVLLEGGKYLQLDEETYGYNDLTKFVEGGMKLKGKKLSFIEEKLDRKIAGGLAKYHAKVD